MVESSGPVVSNAADRPRESILGIGYSLLVGEQPVHAQTGLCVHLPLGVQHGFRNTTDRSATFLCWVLPGTLAGFFDAFKCVWSADAKQPVPIEQEDIDKMMASADWYGIEILGSK